MTPYDHLGFLPPFFNPIGLLFLPLVMALVLWTIVVKGFALWNAARNGQQVWFIALLIVNTLGVLEVIYLIWFRGDRGAKSESVVTPIEPAMDSTVESSDA